jgi:regulator of protease activity HflC (stomatin/prohibitin superfamily)
METRSSRRFRFGLAASLGVLLTSILVFIFVSLGLIALFGLKSVHTYEACLLIRGGKIEEDWSAGLHWRFLPFSDVACYRTSRTTYEASPGERGSGADYNEPSVDARSSDGQRIEAVSFRIAFHVPLVMTDEQGNVVDENNLHTIYTEVGAKNEDALVSSVIAFYARPEVRTVMQLHTGAELLQGDLGVVNRELEDRLRPVYAARGIILEDVVISKPDFTDDFELKIEQLEKSVIDIEIERQKSLQAVEQGEARVIAANADATVTAFQAQGDASRTVTQANADATVVSIQAGAEADRTISQANADATVVSVGSQAEADRTTTQANAEATAIALQVAAYGGSEGFLRAQQIEAMSDWPVQIIGENSALPIIQMESPTPVGTPTATAAPE